MSNTTDNKSIVKNKNFTASDYVSIAGATGLNFNL